MGAPCWARREGQDLTGLEIRYRIREGVAELAFTNAFKGELENVLRRVPDTFAVRTSGSYTFVKAENLDLSDDARADWPTPSDVEAIVDGLEGLMEWWGAVR